MKNRITYSEYNIQEQKEIYRNKYGKKYRKRESERREKEPEQRKRKRARAEEERETKRNIDKER